MTHHRKTMIENILKIEGVALNLREVAQDWIDLPAGALDALRAHVDGINALASMLRDRDEMIDEMLKELNS